MGNGVRPSSASKASAASRQRAAEAPGKKTAKRSSWSRAASPPSGVAPVTAAPARASTSSAMRNPYRPATRLNRSRSATMRPKPPRQADRGKSPRLSPPGRMRCCTASISRESVANSASPVANPVTGSDAAARRRCNWSSAMAAMRGSRDKSARRPPRLAPRATKTPSSRPSSARGIMTLRSVGRWAASPRSGPKASARASPGLGKYRLWVLKARNRENTSRRACSWAISSRWVKAGAAMAFSRI